MTISRSAWLFASMFASVVTATGARADCSSDVCPQYQAPSAFENFVNVGPCSTVSCVRAWQQLPDALFGSTDNTERATDNMVNSILQQQGYATQGTIDDAIVDDFVQQNTFGGRSPNEPFDAGGVGSVVQGQAVNEGPYDPGYVAPAAPRPDFGGVGTIYNGGSSGMDTGSGVIYNSPD